ncbi:6-phosphogluconate dehydrogenase [Lacinutrix sp.]|uniref:6-phosphogluconate dehydrogenase n=1 Tax=Lacinutrix sp. TaxID=1937692 RepID=UPI0025BDA355|nr:6-phosphogluconate dehydrogenase [Lacinutrix sp.]
MIKFLIKSLIAIFLIVAAYFCFIYFVTYSEGVRAGELVKFSNKGVVFKTWEGEISQGVSEAQIFKFSVQGNENQVIKDLNRLQGRFVKLHYFERYASFFWLGDTKYFITNVEEDKDRKSNY